jgi:hypothetical protein
MELPRKNIRERRGLSFGYQRFGGSWRGTGKGADQILHLLE